MGKKISIVLIIIAIILCGVGGVLLFTTAAKANGKVSKTVSKKDDLNYIDRSDFEDQVRRNTGNIYYTVSTSRQLATNRTYDTLELTDPWLVRMSQNLYSFSCVLHNNTDKEYPGHSVVVRFVDQEGKVLEEVDTMLFSIPANGMVTLFADTNVNVLDAYDFEIVPKDS